MSMTNFAMMIPQFGINFINGCSVNNATGDEFGFFKQWVDSGEIIQLSANGEMLDIWINKDPYGLGRSTKTLNGWFDNWKNPPQKTYGFTETIINL